MFKNIVMEKYPVNNRGFNWRYNKYFLKLYLNENRGVKIMKNFPDFAVAYFFVNIVDFKN